MGKCWSGASDQVGVKKVAVCVFKEKGREGKTGRWKSTLDEEILVDNETKVRVSDNEVLDSDLDLVTYGIGLNRGTGLPCPALDSITVNQFS